MTTKTVMICVATIAGIASAAAQTKGLPGPLPAPTIYSAPTPAPMAPLINPGPAVAPPAGLSPLLTEPGPVYSTPERAMPAYPSPQFPGPTGQQEYAVESQQFARPAVAARAQRRQPGKRTQSRIQQQLNQPGSR